MFALASAQSNLTLKDAAPSRRWEFFRWKDPAKSESQQAWSWWVLSGQSARPRSLVRSRWRLILLTAVPWEARGLLQNLVAWWTAMLTSGQTFCAKNLSFPVTEQQDHFSLNSGRSESGQSASTAGALCSCALEAWIKFRSKRMSSIEPVWVNVTMKFLFLSISSVIRTPWKSWMWPSSDKINWDLRSAISLSMVAGSFAKTQQSSTHRQMTESLQRKRHGSELEAWKPCFSRPSERCGNQLQEACLQPCKFLFNLMQWLRSLNLALLVHTPTKASAEPFCQWAPTPEAVCDWLDLATSSLKSFKMKMPLSEWMCLILGSNRLANNSRDFSDEIVSLALSAIWHVWWMHSPISLTHKAVWWHRLVVRAPTR